MGTQSSFEENGPENFDALRRRELSQHKNGKRQHGQNETDRQE